MFAAILSPQILILIAVVALLFGATKIPQFARSIGSARAEFERGQRGEPKVASSDTQEIEGVR